MNMYEKDFLEKLYIRVNKMIENQGLILFLLDQTTHHAFSESIEKQLRSTMDMFENERNENKCEKLENALQKIFGVDL